MFWNVQGASSPEFRGPFKTISRNYCPNMVVLVEPRCSGKQADDFILSSSFGWSHRIEAMGFAWGIWILWQDNFNVTIIKIIDSLYISELMMVKVISPTSL